METTRNNTVLLYCGNQNRIPGNGLSTRHVLGQATLTERLKSGADKRHSDGRPTAPRFSPYHASLLPLHNRPIILW